jgi:hypothetical protein
MRILYVVYTDLHLKLSKSLSYFFKIHTLGPVEINSDFKLSNKKFDFRSFLPIYLFFNKKKIQNLLNDYNYIGISCLNFTMNNIIYSNFKSNNVFITYDGLINLQNIKITPKEKIKDIIKCILFSFKGIQYTIRKNTISGIDIFKSSSGYIDISKTILPIHFYLNINFNRLSNNNSILYISIANDAIDLNTYLLYEEKVLNFISEYFNKRVKIIYKAGINSNYLNKELMLNRTGMENLITEEIVYLQNFDIVCGDVSSLLFNTKILNPSQKVYSVCLDLYCNLFEKSMLKYYSDTLHFFDIKILY